MIHSAALQIPLISLQPTPDRLRAPTGFLHAPDWIGRLVFFLLFWLVFALPASAGTPVVLQLKWNHAFQFAGYYMAKELGYYKEAGLDVHFVEGRPDLNPVDEVLAGRAQFGIGTSSLVLARQAGRPVVVLAAIYQHSPQVLIARQDDAMQSIHDLADATLMLEPGSEEILAYLRWEKVQTAKIRLKAHSGSIADLAEGRVAAMSGYASYEPHLLDMAGVKYHVYSPRSAGIDFYGDNLFTSENEIARNPDQVEAFRAASLRGWQYAMLYPEAAIDLILAKYAPRTSRDFLRFEADRMAMLVRADLVEVGYMTPGRWRHISDTYADLGLMRANFPLDDFLYRLPENRNLALAYKALAGTLALLLISVLIFIYVFRINRRLASAQDALKRSEARYRTLTEEMKDVVWTLDLDTRRFTYISPSVERLRGFTAQEVMSAPMSEALTPGTVPTVETAIARNLSRFLSGETDSSFYDTLELEQPCKDGSTVFTEVVIHMVRNPDSGHIEIHGVTRDISERKRQQDTIRYMAQHDTLTGLANHALFSHHFEQALAVARRERGNLALIYLDLDRFKPINDTFGHAVGDLLLREAAQRIQSCVRDADIVARVGGDEFVILLLGVSDGPSAIAVAEKIQFALQQPFDIEGRKLEISCSQGIALYPEHGDNELELSKSADAAMYEAKRAGRDHVCLCRQTGA